MLGRIGLMRGATELLTAKFMVSVPLEPTCYDLITESDEGLKRFKSNDQQDRI